MLKDVWKKASEEQHKIILASILADGYSRQTAYSFCNGNRLPCELMRGKITSYVNEAMNANYSSEELFAI